MDEVEIDNLNVYREQLKQVDLLISTVQEGPERDELIALQKNIMELLSLTTDNDSNTPSTSSDTTKIDVEYALFQAEISKETDQSKEQLLTDDKTKNLEGMKCRAPHKHTGYHNAIVCSVVENPENSDMIKVRILFTNPTHREMLPCRYYLDGRCRKLEKNCKHSHGEIVMLSELKEYIEPRFDLLRVGCYVLAKNANYLWHRAVVKEIDEDKCLVKFESNQKDDQVLIEHLLPLLNEEGNVEDSDVDDDDVDYELDVINMSLLNKPSGEALGDWEKYTKGIGSKLMQKMGYVTGTGLGRCSDGRVEPVTAVILPQGKSLDYCMKLRENAGGDKNYFNVEKKLQNKRKKGKMKRMKERKLKQSKQTNQDEIRFFNFVKRTLSMESQNLCDKKKLKQQNIKEESIRNLNVANFKIAEDIKKVELDLFKIKESLTRHTNVESQAHKLLKEKLVSKQLELKELKEQSVNITNEQKRRSDHKKMTVF